MAGFPHFQDSPGNGYLIHSCPRGFERSRGGLHSGVGMADPVQHVVLDANLLASYLLKHHNAAGLPARVSNLLEPVFSGAWPRIRVHVPSICLAEVYAVLDKCRFCVWHGEQKTNPDRRLAPRQYEQAWTKLRNLEDENAFHPIEVEPRHMRAVRIVAPVNAKYQFRRRTQGRKGRSKIKPPMGTNDLLVAACAIIIKQRMATEDVVVVTADQRLSDVIEKCQNLTPARIDGLGLKTRAAEAGIRWYPGIFPRHLNLNTASDQDIRNVFGTWPIPSPTMRPRLDTLAQQECDRIWSLWSSLQGSVGKGPDSLPYSMELRYVQGEVARRMGMYFTEGDLSKLLISLRKQGWAKRSRKG